jgi:hypothetical protein
VRPHRHRIVFKRCCSKIGEHDQGVSEETRRRRISFPVAILPCGSNVAQKTAHLIRGAGSIQVRLRLQYEETHGY